MARKFLDVLKYHFDNVDIKNLEQRCFQTEVTSIFFLKAVQQALGKTQLIISL